MHQYEELEMRRSQISGFAISFTDPTFLDFSFLKYKMEGQNQHQHTPCFCLLLTWITNNGNSPRMGRLEENMGLEAELPQHSAKRDWGRGQIRAMSAIPQNEAPSKQRTVFLVLRL